MKAKVLIILHICLCTIAAQAQSPIWAEETHRRVKYPESIYLKGYFVAENNINEPSDEFLNKQITAARTELINSIYVNLASISELDIQNKNTGSDVSTEEIYRLKSASFSKANLSGLQVMKSYNNATKTAFAFVYTKRADVIDYNQKILTDYKTKVDNKLKEAASYQEADNKQLALKAYYECIPILRDAETAQSVLLALQNDLTTIPNRDYFNKAKATVNKRIAALQGDKQLSMDDLAYFMAYGLFIQKEKVEQYIQLEGITYENKGFESEFSNQLEALFEKKLVDVGKYQIGREQPGQDEHFSLVGSYWKEGDFVRVITSLKDANGATVAGAEGRLSLSWLQQNRIDIIPELIRKMNMLNDAKLEARTKRINTKLTRLDKDQPVVYVSSRSNGHPIPNIPVQFIDLQDEKVISGASSDISGLAKGLLTSMKASNRIQRVSGQVDFARYLGLDPESRAFRQLVPELPSIDPAPFFIKISGPTVFVESEERDYMGRPLSVPVLVPSIKNLLTSSGFSFTTDETEADLYITLNSDISDTKRPMGNLNFAYLDCEVNVMDMQSGKTVYGNTFDRLKGGGGSLEAATTDAYKKAAEDITKQLRAALNL